MTYRVVPLIFALFIVLFVGGIGAQNVTFDDADPALTFGNCNVGNSSVGCLGEDCPDQTKLLKGTWHDCGVNPALTFTFTGTAFWIFGVVPSGLGGAPLPMSMVIDRRTILGTDISKLPVHTSNVSLGSVTGLPYGKHSVVIGPQARTTPSYLLVDYVVVDTTPPQVSTTASGPTTGATGSTPPNKSNTAKSPTNSSPSKDSGSKDAGKDVNSDTANHSSNSGAIAGGVIAAIVIILIVIALVFFFIRRRRRQANSASRVDLFADSHSYRQPGMSMSQSGISQPGVDSSVLMQPMTPNHRYSYGQPSPSMSPNASPYAQPAALPPYSDRDLAVSNTILNSSGGYDPYDGIASESGSGLLPNPHPPTIGPSPSNSGTFVVHNRGDSQSGSGVAPSIIGSSRFRQDALSLWAENNRNDISPEVEENLRRAGYQPGHDPDKISPETWAGLGIGPFALQILRDKYKESRPVNRKN